MSGDGGRVEPETVAGPVPAGVSDRLARDAFSPDEVSHIVVHQEIARATGTGRLLVAVCPAHVYAERPDGTVSVAYEGCLECGTCLAVAAPGSLTWRYPGGGFGVAYREG